MAIESAVSGINHNTTRNLACRSELPAGRGVQAILFGEDEKKADPVDFVGGP